MKEFFVFMMWVIDHWYLWGALFVSTGLVKLLQVYFDKLPNVFG